MKDYKYYFRIEESDLFEEGCNGYVEITISMDIYDTDDTNLIKDREEYIKKQVTSFGGGIAHFISEIEYLENTED